MRWPLLLSMLLAACAVVTGTLSRPDVPQPATVTTAETRFGIESADPYRWMEEPARESEMVAWVRAMSAASTPQLQALPDRAAFADLLEASTRAGTRYSDLTSAGGQLFYRRLTPRDRVPSLVVRDGAPPVAPDRHRRWLLRHAVGAAGRHRTRWTPGPPRRSGRRVGDRGPRRDDWGHGSVREGGEFGLPDVVRAAIAKGHRFRALHTSEPWCGLTYASDADLVRRILSANP